MTEHLTGHLCTPPALDGDDDDDDWTCICGQDWFVEYPGCYACGRREPAQWVKFGTGDGTFPLISVHRGGIQYGKITP